MPQTTRNRCITPSFGPSTHHHGKLMDGEGSPLSRADPTPLLRSPPLYRHDRHGASPVTSGPGECHLYFAEGCHHYIAVALVGFRGDGGSWWRFGYDDGSRRSAVAGEHEGFLSSWPQRTRSTSHPCSTTRSASPWCASTAGQRASVALDAAATR